VILPRVSAIRERSSRLLSLRGLEKKGPLLELDETLYTPHMALKRMDNVGIVVDDLGGQ